MDKISIIIPCFNEEENLLNNVLDPLYSYLKTHHSPFEIIIVDDGSTDSSYELCSAFLEGKDEVTLHRILHSGKPAAIYKGIMESEGEIVLLIDMDQSTPIKEMEKILYQFNEGYEIVIGSRGEKREGFSIFRKISSTIFRFIRQLVILKNIKDTQCGFKALKRNIAVQIFPLLSHISNNKEKSGWVVTAYDVELLFVAEKLHYPIKEVEVEWINNDLSKTKKRSGGKFVYESFEMIITIIKVLINDISGKYDF